jgi:hypothetical protein
VGPGSGGGQKSRMEIVKLPAAGLLAASVIVVAGA